MYLFKFRLVKYKRLQLQGATSFEWTPSKSLMIIIGRNGAGKSSVMREISPLPGRKDDFHSGGVKEYHCTHKESIYSLISEYGHGSGYHSFVKDGLELNEGHTFSIQEQLCKQEFNLTREIDDIIKGERVFSKMDVSERKKLLADMSPVCLDYAFDVFNKTAKSLRDKAGQIREVNKRLATDNIKLPDDATLYQFRKENERLVNRLNQLFRESKSDLKPVFRSNDEAYNELKDLVFQAKQLLGKYPRLKGATNAYNRSSFESEVSAHIQEYTAVQAVVDRLADELDTLQRSTAEQGGQITPAELKALQTEHNEALRQAEEYSNKYINTKTKFPIIQFDVMGDAQRTVDNLFTRWMDVAIAIPENAEGWMNGKDAMENKERLKQLRITRRNYEEMYTTVSRRIASLKGCEHVQCPNCQHEFKPGVDPSEQEGLESKQNTLDLKMDQADQEIKRLEEYMEAFQTYSGYAYNFVQITKDYPQFRLLWDYIGGEMMMYREPRKWNLDMLSWKDAMDAYVQSKLLMQRAEIVERRLAVIAEIDQDAVGYLRDRSKQLEAEINTKLLWINARRIHVNEYSDSGLGIVKFQEMVSKLLYRYEDFRDRVKHQAEFLLEQAYQAEIKETQVRLSHSENQLTLLKDQESTVRLMESMVSEASEAHTELNLLVKALAPTGGLIGTYLNGFMQGVCALVNTVISSIWTHPLEVLPSKIDKNEMTYKFPVAVDGVVGPPDIKNGSASQVSVIDFAFKIAILKFLGFDDWPLFLDEFGRDFDHKHRGNIIPCITGFIEMGNYKQIFYISHFEEIHGAFNQAEFVVLDPTNCVVPDTYNKNVLIH